MNKMKPTPKISKTGTKAYAYGQRQKLPIKGKFTASVETSKKIITSTFYIISGDYGSLLSYDTSVQLELVPEINSVTAKSEISSRKVDNLVKQNSVLFQGIGKLKDREIELHIDESVQPVAQPHRRIPFHLREKVENELDRLEQLDIIEKVDGPTDWISPVVIAPKKNEPVHEISNNLVCATSKASDQPAHTRSLIRAFASRLSILGLLIY